MERYRHPPRPVGLRSLGPPFPLPVPLPLTVRLTESGEFGRLGGLSFFFSSAEMGMWLEWQRTPNLQEPLWWKYQQGGFPPVPSAPLAAFTAGEFKRPDCKAALRLELFFSIWSRSRCRSSRPAPGLASAVESTAALGEALRRAGMAHDIRHGFAHGQRHHVFGRRRQVHALDALVEDHIGCQQAGAVAVVPEHGGS